MTGKDEHRTNYAVRIILLLVLIILTVFLIINRDQI